MYFNRFSFTLHMATIVMRAKQQIFKSKDIGNIKLKFKQYSIETLSLVFAIINLKYSKFVLLKVECE